MFGTILPGEILIVGESYVDEKGDFGQHHTHGQVLREVWVTVTRSAAGGPKTLVQEKGPVIRLDDGTEFYGYERSDWQYMWDGYHEGMQECCKRAFERARVRISDERKVHP